MIELPFDLSESKLRPPRAILRRRPDLGNLPEQAYEARRRSATAAPAGAGAATTAERGGGPGAVLVSSTGFDPLAVELV
jgi:hypothetical protein